MEHFVHGVLAEVPAAEVGVGDVLEVGLGVAEQVVLQLVVLLDLRQHLLVLGEVVAQLPHRDLAAHASGTFLFARAICIKNMCLVHNRTLWYLVQTYVMLVLTLWYLHRGQKLF